MQYRISASAKRIKGKRLNLSAQSTVADEIVSVLSPEEPPLPPLSPLPATTPRAPRKQNPQGAVIAGAVLLFLPFLYPLAFFVHGAVTGHPMPFLMYPFLVLIARLISNVGGLVLYLASRAAGFLRKSIGWVSLSAFALPWIGSILLNRSINRIDSSSIVQTRDWIGIATLLSAILCMLALCVLSLVLLKRVYRKNTPDTEE